VIPQPDDDAGSFTVVMPAVLRDRFERWLRREHLQLRPVSNDPPIFRVELRRHQ
jgi:hypothetical protein